MARLIDADKLVAELQKKPIQDGHFINTRDVSDAIFNAPTISPDEVRSVGEWEDAKQHGLCRCSVCKDCYIEKDYITQAKWRFCPNCGAKTSRAEAEKATKGD